jgi:hypothetical protein
MAGFRQGYFTPKHPEKYIGNVNKIRYMSSWELQTDNFLDGNPNVIRWSSETLIIPYIKPTDGKVHKYLVDYYVEYKNTKGEIIKEALEVKPLQQTRPSRSRNPKTKLYESLQYAVNIAKWEAAQKYCNERGIKFRVVTEKSIFK